MFFYTHILLIFVFLTYVSGYDTVDVIGPQIVNFRNNDKINNMSVVLKNIPRSSKMAGLYFKKYWSTFPYKTINVTGNEAVFENLYLNLDWYVNGRVMRSIVILQNNTKYGDKDVMTMEVIENLEEGDKREVPHACLQSCRIIIDYHETPSTESNLTEARHAKPTEDKRNSVRAVSSQGIATNAETPSSSYLNLDIYPNTSIIYKPNSKHNISCIGDNLRVDFDLRLYQIKNYNHHIRSSTKSNVLRTELYLTEQDDDTYLQCYIMWAYHTKATKTINLLLDNSLGVKTAQDETNVVLVVPSQTTSPNRESYWKNFGLVTTTIVIIILLIIIILIVIRTQRIKTQGFLRSDRILSNSVSYMNLLKKYDTGFKTNDDTRGIQTNMEIWKKNECYANENHYDVGAYYSYATNGTHKVYCHSENQHYD